LYFFEENLVEEQINRASQDLNVGNVS